MSLPPIPEHVFYDTVGYKWECFDTHTLLTTPNGKYSKRHMVLVQTIYEDGTNVGPVNNEFISPSPHRARKAIMRRFPHLKPVAVDVSDPLSSFTTSTDILIMIHIIDLERGNDDDDRN